jgi:hypothetical protein
MRQTRQDADPSPYDRYVAARRRSRIKEGVIIVIVLAGVIAYSVERRMHDSPPPSLSQGAAQTH